MSMFMRKRKRSIQLNNRWGSRRNRILIALSLGLISSAFWLLAENPDVNQETYLVAASNISSNTNLEETTFTEVSLDLGELAGQYLKASENNLDEWSVVRPINAGEMISVSSLAPSKYSECAPLVVALAVELAGSIRVGDAIDLWSAEPATGVETIPVEVVSARELMSVKAQEENYIQTAQTIEVCVSPAEIRSVVAAISKKSTIIGVRAQ